MQAKTVVLRRGSGQGAHSQLSAELEKELQKLLNDEFEPIAVTPIADDGGATSGLLVTAVKRSA